jgi:phosphomannomutase
VATKEMKDFLQELRKNVTLGIVGGSDLVKQKEQMGEGIVGEVDYSFSENGLVAYKNGELVGMQSISGHLGEENIKRFVNFVLKYLADIDIPIKRYSLVSR